MSQPTLTPAEFAAKWRGVTTTEKASAQSHFIVCDFLVGDNDARSTAESLDAYFLPFAVAARGQR